MNAPRSSAPRRKAPTAARADATAPAAARASSATDAGDRDKQDARRDRRCDDAKPTASPHRVEAVRAEELRHCAANYDPLPVVLVRGSGSELWDQDGKRYIDMMSAYSAASFGHAHPRLVQALTEQARRLAITSRAYHTDRLAPLAAKLCALTGMDRMLPMNTGAEAVDTAIKAVRKWAYRVKAVPQERAQIIACHGNFHGRTLGAIAMSDEPQYRDGFGPFPPGFLHVPYGDAQALERAIRGETAAFFVEPIQGESGIVVPPAGYLADCARICRQHNVLLVCDEVQTGLGRTGRMLACDHEQVRPDALLLGKALGGGLLPISAFLARADVMAVFQPGDHGSTFGGNPLACAVASAALDLLVEERLVERAAELGSVLLAGLDAIASPLVREVRGLGLFAGVEIDTSMISARRLAETFLAAGILTKDTHGKVLRFAPALTIPRVLLDEALERIERVLQRAGRDARPG